MKQNVLFVKKKSKCIQFCLHYSIVRFGNLFLMAQSKPEAVINRYLCEGLLRRNWIWIVKILSESTCSTMIIIPFKFVWNLLIHCQYLKIFYKRSQIEDVPITRKIKLKINTISRSEDPTGGVGIILTCTQPFFQGLNVDQGLKRPCQHRGPEFRHE
jgi:hypothetical protein